MRPASGKKFVFVERQQPPPQQYTPEKRPPPQPSRGQSGAPRPSQPSQTSQQQTKTKLTQTRVTMLNAPAAIPKYKRPVDVLKYANDIVEKARKVENGESSLSKEVQQQQQTPKEHRESKGQVQIPVQPVIMKKQTSHTEEAKEAKNKLQPKVSNKQQPKANPTSKLAKQFEQRQKQLLSKIDFLQQQIKSSSRQFSQLQTKYNSLVKQHKNCSKQIKRMTQAVKQNQAQFAKMLSNQDIPYDRKRQCILQSQIKGLRQYNRELTLRIKAYKGSDLADLAVHQNKVNVLNQYQKSLEGEEGAGVMLEFESQTFQIVKELDGYLNAKSKKKLTFGDQQKFIVNLQRQLTNFCMSCLIQGITLPTSPQQPLPNLQTIQDNPSSRLLDDYQMSVKNTEYNLKICEQFGQILQDQSELTTYLQRSNVRKILEECLNSKNRKDIQKNLEDRLLTYVDRHRRFIFVLLTVVKSTVSRYDVLASYLTETINRIQADLKVLSKPLNDLKIMYEYGGESNDQSYLEKLAIFIRNNIDSLCINTSSISNKLPQLPINFSKLRNIL